MNGLLDEEMVLWPDRGKLYGIAAALPVFREQQTGHFINIASTAARKTAPGQAVYSCTKAAVLALSDGLRQELAGKLRVTVISPMHPRSFADERRAFLPSRQVGQRSSPVRRSGATGMVDFVRPSR